MAACSFPATVLPDLTATSPPAPGRRVPRLPRRRPPAAKERATPAPVSKVRHRVRRHRHHPAGTHGPPSEVLRAGRSQARLAAGADLARVQRLAGHRGPATTERYERRPDDALREAATLVHIPYFGPAP